MYIITITSNEPVPAPPEGVELIDPYEALENWLKEHDPDEAIQDVAGILPLIDLYGNCQEWTWETAAIEYCKLWQKHDDLERRYRDVKFELEKTGVKIPEGY